MNNIRHLLLITWLFVSVGITNAQQPRLVVPMGHTWRIDDVKISPSGNELMTITASTEIKIWQKSTGKLLVSIPTHPDYIMSAEFSPDGKKVLTNSSDGTRVFDIAKGILLFMISKPSSWATGLNWRTFSSYSSNGNSIISLSNLEINIYNAETGRLIDTKKGYQSKDRISKQLYYTEFSNDKRKAVQLFEDTTIVWDLQSLSPIMGFEKIFRIDNLKYPFWKKCIKFSDNGNLLAYSFNSKFIGLLDLSNNRDAKYLFGHQNRINSINFSSDSRFLVSASMDSTAIIWDLSTFKKTSTLKGHLGPVSYAEFSKKNDFIVTASFDKTAKLWDLEKRQAIKTFYGHDKVLMVALFIDQNFLVTTSEDRTAKIWNKNESSVVKNLSGIQSTISNVDYRKLDKKIMTTSENYQTMKWDRLSASLESDLTSALGYSVKNYYNPVKKQILCLKGLYNEVDGTTLRDSLGLGSFSFTYAEFSKDGKMLLTLQRNNYVNLFDTEDGHLIHSFKNDRLVNYATFNNDGSKLLLIELNDSLKIYDLKSKELQYGFRPGFWATTFELAKFSNNDDEIFAISNDQELKIYDYKKHKVKHSLKNINGGYIITSMDYSPSKNLILISKGDFRLTVLHGNSLKSEFERVEHKHLITAAKFIENGDEIITSSIDNTIKLWDVANSKLIFSLSLVDSQNYFAQIPSGYYKCTPDAAKLLHYVTSDLKVITFEQLDVKYNRPDKVLEAIGSMDTALINSYRKSYEKRIKKLGIDTSAFKDGYSVPEADFVNRNSIEYEQKSNKLKIHILGSDNSYFIDRFNVWINEVPIFGQRGIRIGARKQNTIDTSFTITLAQGENRIETSITNVNGTESYRMPLEVKYSPSLIEKPKVYFIGIGIEKFENPAHNLTYSVKDIRNISSGLRKKYGNSLVVDTLFNEKVTIKNIKALKQKLLQTNESDKVIISYSGHGILSKDYDYFLSTYSINFLKPEINGLPYDELENLLDSIPARKKLMLIDACHSGEVDKEDGIAMNQIADSMGLKKGSELLIEENNSGIGLKNSFELMQSLFVNVGKSTGATIISAAAGNQYALERGDLQNGVFTYCLLQAMNNNPTLKVSELKKEVSQQVEKLTNGLQKPTSRNETIASDWEVW